MYLYYCYFTTKTELNIINLRSRRVVRKEDEDKTSIPPTTIPHARWIIQDTHNSQISEKSIYIAKLVFHPTLMHQQGCLKQYSMIYTIQEWLKH